MKLEDINLITDPEAIERESMAIIDSEVPEPRPYEGEEWQVVRRMIHTTADFEMCDLVRFSPGAVEAGKKALAKGCTVFTDTRMAQCGIPLRRLTPLGGTTISFMNDPGVAERAKREGITRAIAAVDKAAEDGNVRIYVIGNAPTALIRLVELIREGKAKPDLIVGMPVGFVNAAESKALLMDEAPCPYITIEGRKGGSALAACVINALAEMVLADEGKQSL